MTLTAAQYSQIAQGYENAAADPWVAAEKRVNLLNKAEWFRFLAERGNQADREDNTHAATAAFEGSARRSMSPFLATLWVTGAAVYLFGTVLFTIAVFLRNGGHVLTRLKRDSGLYAPVGHAALACQTATVAQIHRLKAAV